MALSQLLEMEKWCSLHKVEDVQERKVQKQNEIIHAQWILCFWWEGFNLQCKLLSLLQKGKEKKKYIAFINWPLLLLHVHLNELDISQIQWSTKNGCQIVTEKRKTKPQKISFHLYRDWLLRYKHREIQFPSASCSLLGSSYWLATDWSSVTRLFNLSSKLTWSHINVLPDKNWGYHSL